MSMAYVVTQMPAPSEAFLSLEVSSLIRSGVKVEVFCLRARHPHHEKLIGDQNLSDVAIHNFPFLLSWPIWRDVGYWLRRSPGVFWLVLMAITRSCWKRPNVFLKSLAIVPKSFRIARCVEQGELKIVHAAWGHYPAITVYLIRQLMPHVQFTLALGAYDRVMQHPMTAIAADSATCILTQSEASAGLLANRWPKPSSPIIVIRRGIDVKTTSSPREATEKRPGLIVSCGRLIEVKGHQYVLRAFKQVHQAMPRTRLLIIGEGGFRRKLEQLATRLDLTDSVTFLGHLSQSEAFRHISQCSVFVLASKSEADNLPNTVKEAMSIGVPVITTPTVGIEELVEDGVTGCIVPMGSPEAISNTILRLLSDNVLAGRLVAQARQQVTDKFDIHQTTLRRKLLYETLTRFSDSKSALDSILRQQPWEQNSECIHQAVS